jgi:hypothetical protein
MSTQQQHVINSMRLDLSMPDKALAREVQERLSKLAHGKLLPAVEAVFSEVCPSDVTHQLERLVVDLGVVPLDRLEEEILAQLMPQLKLALGEIQQAAPGQGALGSHSASTRFLESDDVFYIDNAGLVLLSPFFTRYHDANGLLLDGLFRDDAAAERGVHLLQLLLTAGAALLEQALVLNKLLCGLSPATPVVREIDSTDAERTHANTLLQSAIQNWPSVGNISIDDFRGSFLWRKGKLTRGEKRWTLTIEHRGYDVLFSSLPWSFSVIKPLWMPDPLYVDWV